ncbi:MAG: hypothetical protein JST00_27680 [Deltaproteobacteria bacterium]|nr:hypothetical protein [Deltaproteobacteria bacterium]
MSQRTAVITATLALAVLACPPPPVRKPIEMESIGTVKNVPRAPGDEPSVAGDPQLTTPNSGTPVPGTKEAACTGGDFEDLLESLKSCEGPAPKASELASNIKDKLEIRLNASTLSTTPGGRVDLTITMRNKSNEPLPLFFTLDPMLRVDFETSDPKGRRVDQPTGKPPKATTPSVSKTAKIVLVPTGTARIKIPWDAMKQKYAPERAAGWAGKGPPRAPNGALPIGKYTIKVLIPLIGVFEGKDALDAPKLPIEVSNT